MTEAPTDLILPILMKLQEEVATIRKDTVAIRKDMSEGFANVDAQFRKQRRDMAGMLVMMKSTAGHFEERVTSLENRVSVLERRPS